MNTIQDLQAQLADAIQLREALLAAPSHTEKEQAININRLNKIDRDIAAIRKSPRDEENAP